MSALAFEVPRPRHLLQFAKRQEIRQAAQITLGTIAAQAVLLITTPILTRLYTPEAFGHLAVLANLSTVGGAVAALCYQVAIFFPRSTTLAVAIFRLSVYLCIVGSAVCAATYAVFVLARNGAWPAVWPDLLLIYFGIAFSSLFIALGNVETRANRFWSVALSKFNSSLLPAVAQIALAFAGIAQGLQIGRVAGQLGTIAIMLGRLPREYGLRKLLRPRWRELRLAALRYKDTPIHVPRVLAVRASGGLTATLILASYGPALAGLYFVAERLIERPGILFSDTLMRLPVKIFSERIREQQTLARPALAYVAVCAAVILPGVLALAFAGPWLLRMFLGPSWDAAGPFVILLAISAGARLTTMPMLALIVALRIHVWTTFIDFAFLPRVLVIPVAAYAGYGVDVAVACFVALTFLYYLVSGVVTYAAASRYDRSLGGRDFSGDRAT